MVEIKTREMSLEELNEVEVKQYIGGVVFVTLLMVCGIIGNIHVLLIYAFKIKPSNHRIFILVLGVLDFITCIIGMPFIIVDLRNPLTFTMVAACKVLRFVNYYICTASALTLLVIAVDRYRKICVPLGRQMSHTMAKLSCLLVLVVALLLSWPAPILYGKDTILTSNPNINGTRCYTEDRFKNTKFQAYFNAVLILVVFGVFFILVVLYGLIGRTISKHKTFKSNLKTNEYVNKTKSDGSDTNTVELSHSKGSAQSAESNKRSDVKKEELPEAVDFSSNVSEPVSSYETTTSAPFSSDTETTMIKKMKGKTEKSVVAATNHTTKTMDKLRRTTFMLFLITLVFFLSYVPHLVLKIITFSKKDFVPGLNFTGQVFYNTFIWCFFINNVANSFIYGFCDFRFRNEVKIAYTRLFTLLRII